MGADANFFVHGGHSLLGAQLVRRIEEETGLEVRLVNLFAQQTPMGLAALLREENGLSRG
jgi:hypothetical protein